MGHVLHSRVSAADICYHIGNEMRKNVVKAIKDSREKIGIMIGEATTNSLKSSLIVCLQFFWHGKPTSMFLNLIELEKSDSQTILNTLLGCMRKHGMDSHYLQEYLIKSNQFIIGEITVEQYHQIEKTKQKQTTGEKKNKNIYLYFL